jgi:hypothetical protein
MKGGVFAQELATYAISDVTTKLTEGIIVNCIVSPHISINCTTYETEVGVWTFFQALDGKKR